MIESVAETWLKSGPAALAVLALVLALLVRFRTSSSHTVLRWLWRQVAGKATGNDTRFNAFMDGQANLNQFRFISGRARTVAQMHSLIRWSARHDEDILDMQACGPYFDRERPGLKPAAERPGNVLLGWVYVTAALLALLSLLTVGVACAPGALVTVKETGRWLIIGEQKTLALSSPGTQRLAPGQCQQAMPKKIAIAKLPEADINVICGFYADPDALPYIRRIVLEQRVAFGMWAMTLMGFFWIATRFYRHGNAARNMAQRLDRPRP